ncbi:MAG: VWA domain-containing protein [Acidobacteria bacterium]|nr:VWA domain-containing protein [Acidobacteriota bacterium]
MNLPDHRAPFRAADRLALRRARQTAFIAVAAAIALAGVRSGGQAPPAPQRPAFRAGVEVVSLAVTVTEPDGRYVTDLTPEDFQVFEDGNKQDVTFFDKSNLPIALSLLLDTSASMEERIGTAQEAAIGFAKRLRPQDLAELIDFDTRVEVMQAFTNNVPELEGAIRQTTAGGSTSLYNAVYIALKELKKVQARSADEIRRQAIVVFSDGEDTSSLVTFEQVLDLAKRSETAIYSIGLRPRDEIQGKGFKEADFVLREFAQQTGGRAFFPAKVEDLAGVYAQIAEELSSQYMLGYISKNNRRDGSWRRVVVRVGRPGATTRTKQGYFAPTAR